MTSQNTKWKNPALWLWAAVIAYAVLQFFTLGTRSFDGDEGLVLRAVLSSNWQEFWTRIAADVHPPLFHILAKTSVSVFGIHEWSLRLPPAVAGGLLIIASFWIGKKIWRGSKWKPLLLGIAMGFSPYLFYYFQDARLYPIFLLGVVLTFGALIDLNAGEKILKSAFIYTIGALIMVYSQHLGWLILASELLCILILRKWRMALWLLPILSVVILLYLPIIRITIAQFTGRLSEQGGLLLMDNINGIIGAFYRFGAGRLVLGIEPASIVKLGVTNTVLFAGSLIVPLLLIFYGIKSDRSKPWNALLITLTIVSLAVALLVSEIGGRASRYLIYLWPFYGVLLIDGASKIYRTVIGRTIIILFIAISLTALGKHLFVENQTVGVKQIASLLDEKADKNDIVVIKGALAGGEKAVLDFYLRKNINIYDYYENYTPGALSGSQQLISTIINQQLTKHPTLWYYDFTYGELKKGNKWSIAEYPMGEDKEGKSIVVHKIKSL